MITRLCAFLCVLIIFASIGGPVRASEPRVALIVGNSNYGPEIGKLKNPANDARLMADTLKGLGFSVDLVLDADQKTMKRAIKSFGAKLREAGQDATGFFYYAGHGVQVDGTNYLLPVGADIEVEADVDIESVPADDVMTQMQSAGNAVNLVFLDACRNNPLARTSRSATRGLARLDAPRGSFVGYSTAPGDVAQDGDGANSPYALALAEELKKPGISIEEAHRNVRAKVLAETGDKQTPWDSSSLTGPIVLAAKIEAPAPQPAAQPAPQPQVQQQASVDKEALFWESIKGSTDPADFEAYIVQYPQGTFVALANNKIAKLSKSKTVPAGEPSTPKRQSAATQGDALRISPEVSEQIESYLRNLNTQDYSALAISKDGAAVGVAHCTIAGSNVASYCRSPSGRDEMAKAEAIKRCGGPVKCFVLYKGETKVAQLDLVVQGAGDQAAAAATEPQQPAAAQSAALDDGAGSAMSGTFSVSAEVKEEIEEYLGKVGGAGAWVFAVTKDGTAAAYAHCGGQSNSAGCPRISNPKLAAQNAAIRNCGGPGKCIVLYEDTKKLVSGAIVVQ